MNNKTNIWTKRYLKVFTLISIIGTIIGGITAYIYYYQVGCNSNGCAIWSKPYNSILWGAAMGYLISDMFVKKEEKKLED